MNGIVSLSADTLARLDRGRIGVAIDQAIQTVQQDCEDRPTDERARVVTITLSMVPKHRMLERVAQCESAEATCKVSAKLPAHESGKMSFGVTHEGMTFSEDNPTDHRQGSLLPQEDKS